MSTLTSLVKSGKRKIIKEKTPLGLPDQRASQDPLRPEHHVPGEGAMTTLGLPDRGVSQDPLRPAHEVPGEDSTTTLGRPDQGVSQDPMRPSAK